MSNQSNNINEFVNLVTSDLAQFKNIDEGTLLFLGGEFDCWEKIAFEELKGIKTDRLIKETPEGIKVKPLYTKDDLENLNHINSLPGMEPFVRGPKATMYTSRPWTVRQYSGFSTAKESNKANSEEPCTKCMPLFTPKDLGPLITPGSVIG